MSRPNTGARLKQLALVVDLGGSSTKVSTCEYNARGDIQSFHRVTQWPGRTGDIAYAPTIVAELNNACSGETRRSWGWEASNDLSDHGSEFTKHDKLKFHMMEPDKTPEKDDMRSICLFYVRSLLEHIIAGRRSDSLLIEVAVPMLVDMKFHERLKMTNFYKEIFRLASPAANTLIWIVDEPTVGRIGAKELVARILAEAGESFDEYKIFTSVDSGSTTTDMGTSEQCELDGAVIDKFLTGESLRYGSNMINEVIHNSDLSKQDQLTLEERLESRKGNLQEWVSKVPDGPAQLHGSARATMDAILEAERIFHEEVLNGVETYLNSEDIHSRGSGRKHLVILYGGAFGSKSLAEAALRRLDNQEKYPGIKVVLTCDLKYSHQAVQVGMENVARDHRLALTEPPRHDIFIENHKGSVKKPTRRPLQIWSRDSTFEHYFVMDKKSKPLAIELEASSGTKTVSKGLKLSITLYVPRTASLKIKTSQAKNDPAPVARSRKGLKDTGQLEVALPIESSVGTVYMLSAIIARTAIFGIIFNKKGTYVSQLEDHTVTAKDLFENGIFSGRLRQKYTEMGLLYMEVDSALLPELERHEMKKQGPRGTKRTRDEIEVIELSSDDDQQGRPVRGFNQGYQKLPSAKAPAGEQLRCHTESPRTNTAPIDLHPTKKRAVSVLHDSAALAGGPVAKSFRTIEEQAEVRDFDSLATPISNSKEMKAQLYRIHIEEAMVSADTSRLATCLTVIKDNNFSRAIAEGADLLCMIKEVSVRHEFPETVLGPCRFLLESWKNSSDCEDGPPGRFQTQRAGDGEANDGGSATTQDPSPAVDDFLHAVDG